MGADVPLPREGWNMVKQCQISRRGFRLRSITAQVEELEDVVF